jgi:zinc ribbon protein
MIYLLCALLGSGVLAAICVPLFRKENTLESAIIEETEWDLLQRKKEVVLGNIQDLDFEYKCGKLSDEDYNRVRGEMAGEYAAVLRKVDEIESSQDLDALIRRELAARKGRKPIGTEASAPAAGSVACPSCGTDNPPANKFCAECGAKLKG